MGYNKFKQAGYLGFLPFQFKLKWQKPTMVKRNTSTSYTGKATKHLKNAEHFVLQQHLRVDEDESLAAAFH